MASETFKLLNNLTYEFFIVMLTEVAAGSMGGEKKVRVEKQDTKVKLKIDSHQVGESRLLPKSRLKLIAMNYIAGFSHLID